MAYRPSTHLMFTGEASAALELYSTTFPSFLVQNIVRYGAGEPGPEGTVMRADVSFAGHMLVVIDSPVTHAFTFTPSMSLFVDCDTADDFERAFAALSEGGEVLMPPDNYGFSTRFAWCKDRFGMSWQLNVN